MNKSGGGWFQDNTCVQKGAIHIEDHRRNALAVHGGVEGEMVNWVIERKSYKMIFGMIALICASGQDSIMESEDAFPPSIFSNMCFYFFI